MRAFGIFAAFAAISSVFAAPMPAQPKGLVARDVSVGAAVTVDINLACLINTLHTDVETIKDDVVAIIGDTTTTATDKVNKLAADVHTLIIKITTFTTQVVLSVAGNVVGTVTGVVGNVSSTVDTTVDNTAATVGATLKDVLSIIANIICLVIQFLNSVSSSVGAIAAALIVVVKTVLGLVNTLLATVIGIAGVLKDAVGVDSFTAIVTSVAQQYNITIQ